MKISRVIGLSSVAVVAAIVLPAIVPAQDQLEQQPPVRVTLLENGEIQVTGEFVLDVDGVTSFLAKDITAGEEAFYVQNGLTVDAEDFVLTTDAARMLRGSKEIQMRGARISPKR